ncbi:hypothetical protein CEXT_164471 [Caerostris extrusa]|uniref:Uncharacterized protein n=1 Tax=Caerostris extrusa TaxID=172846 RepID=A0AAV4P5G1_CAEEX|nr:hypothetical protein CEXT_164471 [Caerostris extrusa]
MDETRGCDLCCSRVSLLPSSTTASVQIPLLPSSNTASCDFLCCRRFQLLSSSSAAVVFYSWDFCGHRLLLLPSSNIASCDFLCCRRLQLVSSSSSAAVIFLCYHRLSLLLSPATIVRLPFTVVVLLCCSPHDDFERNTFCHI